MKPRPIVFAFLFAASPLTGALAQQTTSPAVGAGNKTEATELKDGAAMKSTTPGATGTTVVPGSTSTVGGDKSGTTATKTDSTGTAGGGK